MAAPPLRSAFASTSLTASNTSARVALCSSPRRLSSYSPVKAQVQSVTRPRSAAPSLPDRIGATPTPPSPLNPPRRNHDHVNTYFDSTGVLWVGFQGDQQPHQDPNKAKLGKTLRILQERLPTLLQSPLPQHILAPNISLQLFPSTHPHLPTVSGRVAYNAALWTSPIAWNRVPIVGNVRIEILAERMTAEPLTFLARRPGAVAEQLVVRWCEKKRKPSGDKDAATPAPRLALGRRGDGGAAFTGLFIFDFDSEGRVLTHTIEHAQEGGNWERGMGAKFVGLTDWLLGGMKGPGDAPLPMCEQIRR